VSRRTSRFLFKGVLPRAVLIVALAGPSFAGLAATAVAQTQVAKQNNVTGAGAGSGPALGANRQAFAQAPVAVAVLSAQAQQRGRNTARVRQTSAGKTGDVVAGSQVTGVTGDAKVMNSNNASLVLGVSGLTAVSNGALVQVGPLAVALSIAAGGASFGSARASQMGDNSMDVGQEVTGETGDALAASQVTGIVDAEDATISHTNSGFINLAITGPTIINNAAIAVAGPDAIVVGAGALPLGDASASQFGSNEGVLDQSATATTGDALGGSQVAGIVGGSTFRVQQSNSADVNLSIALGILSTNLAPLFQVGPLALSNGFTSTQQAGGNAADATQNVEATTGEAVSGSQVTGIVAGDDADIAVSVQQASNIDFADSEVAIGVNTLTVDAGGLAVGLTVPRSLTAKSSQLGSNGTKFAQTAAAATSSAVTASQITGTVAGDNSKVRTQASNRAPFSAAFGLSGGAVSGSQVDGVVAGDDSDVSVSKQNSANGLGLALAVAQASTGINTANATAGPAAIAVFVADASQAGDNRVDGSQVGNDGDTATITAGPLATTGAANPTLVGVASASQLGNDDVILTQESVSASGDAVSASQVTGVVNGVGSSTRVQASNQALLSLAVSGAIPVPNVATVTVGATANVGLTNTGLERAQAQQAGNANASITQSVDASTGDGVAGSQVTGMVGADDDRQAQVSNSALLALGLSGTATPTNVATGTIGATATTTVGLLGANASMAGSTSLGLDQGIGGASGDAVTAAQITGAA
jgi:hypothetical protein